MEPRPLIIKTGSTLPQLARRRGDFEDWIIAGAGWRRDQCLVVDVTRGEGLPPPAAVTAVVVTGSHAMVTDRTPWSERAARWLAELVEAGGATLGICYGHQLLAHALGGEVVDNPLGREMGTVAVRLESRADADPLLGGLPDPVLLQVSHTQTVSRLPAGAETLARSAMDRHQAFHVPGTRAWGVQFHPEFAPEVTAVYIEHRRAELVAAGADPEALLSRCVETPAGQQILRRFASLARR